MLEILNLQGDQHLELLKDFVAFINMKYSSYYLQTWK